MSDKRRQLREGRFVENAAASDEASWDDIQSHVDEAIAALPEKIREPLIGHFLEGQTYDEIAKTLGIPRSTAASRVQKGLETVRKSLKKRGIPISAAGLATLVAANTSHAAPASLVAALGKLSIAGTGGSGVAAATAGGAALASKLIVTGGIGIMTKKVLTVVGVLLLLGVFTYSLHELSGRRVIEEEPEAIPEAAKKPEAEPPDLMEGESVALQAEKVTAAPSPEDENALPEEKPEALLSASISGYVMDNEGYPVGGASIYIEIIRGTNRTDVAKTYSATTDEEGRYEVTAIDTFGEVFAFASAEGYVMKRVMASVSAGTKQDDVNFALTTADFFVAGWVVSEDQEPIPGASVGTPYFGYCDDDCQHLAHKAAKRGRAHVSDLKLVFATTDERGYFNVAIPEEGFCDFTVTAEGYGPGFFPKVHTGTEDAVFVLSSFGAIAGRVTRPDGTPVEDVTVRAVGEVFAGGRTTGGKSFKTSPVVVTTGSQGDYLCEHLGADYSYTVTVPGSEPENETRTPQDEDVRHIAAMLRSLMRDESMAEPIRAQVKGVRVQAGRTTTGVDLVIRPVSSTTAVIHGTVTDSTTGAPACGVTVEAAGTSIGLGDMAVTNRDGSYILRIGHITETYSFLVRYTYLTEGGNAWPEPEGEIATLELGPGDDEELNFAVDAPIVVPVRYVDTNGVPLVGIEAAIRQAGGGGGCGGVLESDIEGRVTFHGIPPFLELEALAWRKEGALRTMGVSDPFVGQPGETVPEVLVVCHGLGGIEGIMVDSSGQPIPHVSVPLKIMQEDGSLLWGCRASTDAQGAFCVLDSLPEGVCAQVFFVVDKEDHFDLAVIEDIEIVADAVTNVGTIVLEPVSREDAMRMLAHE
jgi:hypothetical protein